MDREFEFSQAMSSIEVRQTDREMQNRAALIPGFVAEKVSEILSSESDSNRDKFGTGDFPEEARGGDIVSQPQPRRQEAEYEAVNRDQYNLSQNDHRTHDDKQLTQRFDA